MDDATITFSCGTEVKVDEADLPLLSSYSWHPERKPRATYAKAWADGRKVYMHRLVLGLDDPGIHVDHINGDGLDNRRGNLRVATNLQNQHNRRPNRRGSSCFKGVGWHRATNKWQARIGIGGRQVQIGLFEDEVEAARAYDAAAVKNFGEFARPNFEPVGVLHDD